MKIGELGKFVRWGNEAVNIFSEINKHQAEYEFVRDMQNTSYLVHFGIDGQAFIRDSYGHLHENLHRIQEYFTERRNAFTLSILPDLLNSYKKNSLNRTLSLVGLNKYIGTIVDFGSNLKFRT